MNSKPLVSVIICFFNTEKFIREAIESVFAQSYDAWELLLVDDGSIDGSTYIAKEFTNHYPQKVRYLEHDGHQNKGISSSRNLGIRNAKGVYTAFLDADDIWLPQKLEQQVAILESHPEVAMVYGPGRLWYGWTGIPDDIQRDSLLPIGVKSDTILKPMSLLALFLRDDNFAPCVCSILIRRQAINRIGGFEEFFRGMYEDQVFFAKLSIESSVLALDESWALYRQHPDSMCFQAGQEGKYHESRQIFLEWVEKYLTRKKIRNIRLWILLKNELFPYRYPALYRILRK